MIFMAFRVSAAIALTLCPTELREPRMAAAADGVVSGSHV